jgi:hypothetical protein
VSGETAISTPFDCVWQIATLLVRVDAICPRIVVREVVSLHVLLRLRDVVR